MPLIARSLQLIPKFIWHQVTPNARCISMVNIPPGQRAAGQYYEPVQVLGLSQKKPVGEAFNLESSLSKEASPGYPRLFQPLTIRGVRFHSRIMVSPMCMYSCVNKDGMLTDFHLAHYGSLALRGPALVMVESTAVTSSGRLSPYDSGAWNDEHVFPLKRVAKLVHASGSKIGLQLCHGGRKSSAYPPFHEYEETKGKIGRVIVPWLEGGFAYAMVAPSPIPWKPDFPKPRELDTGDIRNLVRKFAKAAYRGAKAGVDCIEIHAAHGYIIHQFLSGNTNKRTDNYGGSLENRQRFLLEIIEEIRKVIPKEMPLFCRVSGTDLTAGGDQDPDSVDLLAKDPDGWDIWQTLDLCRNAASAGVDVIDVSSGGNLPTRAGSRISASQRPGFQLLLAEQVKKAKIDGVHVASVGGLSNAKFCEQAMKEGKMDMLFSARGFLRHANLVYTMAEELGVPVRRALQYSWIWPWHES